MRKKRQWYRGAIYHVMQRGIRRKEIFIHDVDYMVFLEKLDKEAKRYDCNIHAYCLMTNHIHLLIETKDKEIWKFMKELSCGYARYFNEKNNYKGHLFEGRYVSSIVEDDSYFLQTSRYIHLNPVKAKIVYHPEDYKWSSYNSIIGAADCKFVNKNKTLSYFKNNSIYSYRNFVEYISKKYYIFEDKIKNNIGEDDLWLPW